MTRIHESYHRPGTPSVRNGLRTARPFYFGRKRTDTWRRASRETKVPHSTQEAAAGLPWVCRGALRPRNIQFGYGCHIETVRIVLRINHTQCCTKGRIPRILGAGHVIQDQKLLRPNAISSNDSPLSQPILTPLLTPTASCGCGNGSSIFTRDRILLSTSSDIRK